jgi:hypothetical protein
LSTARSVGNSEIVVFLLLISGIRLGESALRQPSNVLLAVVLARAQSALQGNY